MTAAEPRLKLPSDPGPFAARCKAGHVLALGHLYGPCPICTPPRPVAAAGGRKGARIEAEGVALEGYVRRADCDCGRCRL